MTENGIEAGLLVRAEPLQWAEDISHRMVDVVRLEDETFLLKGALYPHEGRRRKG